MEYTCTNEGCKRTFRSSKGLRQHVSQYCAAKHASAASIIEKAKQTLRARLETPVSGAGSVGSPPVAAGAVEHHDVDMEDIAPAQCPVDLPQPFVAEPDMYALPPTRSRRERRFPGCYYQDMVPSQNLGGTFTSIRAFQPPVPAPIPSRYASPKLPDTPTPEPEAEAEVPLPVQTAPDAFGVYRIYPRLPTFDPRVFATLQTLREDAPPEGTDDEDEAGFNNRLGGTRESDDDVGAAGENQSKSYEPFPNATTFLIMNWHLASKHKSNADTQRLVDNVLKHKDFSVDHLADFSIHRKSNRLLKKTEAFKGDGWTRISVFIPLPGVKVRQAENDAPTLEVPNVWLRSITNLISSFFSDLKLREDVHLTPYSNRWVPPWSDEPELIQQELYDSPAVLEVYKEVRQVPQPKGEQYEIVVAIVMLWSDATHLAQFGSASLWPIYMFMGNASKYLRVKPTSFSALHVAYIPLVSEASASTLLKRILRHLPVAARKR
jgi:hypothetical protein